MAKEKKLTVKIYENKQVGDAKSFSREITPLYLTLTFNRKAKNMKSPTFEFMVRLNFGYDLIKTKKEQILKNDERLFAQFRKFVESRGEEFSLDFISPENEEYQKLKTPLFDIFSNKFKMSFTFFFFELGEEKKINFTPVQLILMDYPNIIHFWEMIEILTPEITEEFRLLNQELVKQLDVFRKMEINGKIPFVADLEMNEEFFGAIEKIILRE